MDNKVFISILQAQTDIFIAKLIIAKEFLVHFDIHKESLDIYISAILSAIYQSLTLTISMR